jgi:hypothetical protein
VTMLLDKRISQQPLIVIPRSLSLHFRMVR